MNLTVGKHYFRCFWMALHDFHQVEFLRLVPVLVGVQLNKEAFFTQKSNKKKFVCSNSLNSSCLKYKLRIFSQLRVIKKLEQMLFKVRTLYHLLLMEQPSIRKLVYECLAWCKAIRNHNPLFRLSIVKRLCESVEMQK